jgi:hypothetical protein
VVLSFAASEQSQCVEAVNYNSQHQWRPFERAGGRLCFEVCNPKSPAYLRIIDGAF